MAPRHATDSLQVDDIDLQPADPLALVAPTRVVIEGPRNPVLYER
jgi:hypothetical protein